MDIDTIKQIFKDIDGHIEEYRTIRNQCEYKETKIIYDDIIHAILNLKKNLTKKYFSRNKKKYSKP